MHENERGTEMEGLRMIEELMAAGDDVQLSDPQVRTLLDELREARSELARLRQESAQALAGSGVEQLAELLNEAVGILRDGVLHSANDKLCRMFGYRRDELVGQQLIRLIGAPESQKLLQQRINSGSQEPFEAVGTRADRSTLPIEIRTGRVEIGGAAVWVVVVRDLSEQSEEDESWFESQMLRAQKLKSLSRLAGGVAHDFNNLLMGILGNAELANLKLPPLSPVQLNISEIEKAASRAADLANQLLAFSGKGRINAEPLNLSAVTEDVVKLLNASAPDNFMISCELQRDLPPVMADLAQLQQVVSSLVSNSIDAIGESGGSISVTTSVMECDRAFLQESYVDDGLPAGSYVCLEVADSGCGMDEETQSELFEPFFSTKIRGRGWGLAAVLGIVRSNQGAIKVESTPGMGARIMVLLPAAEPVEAEEQPEERPARDDQYTGTVLLADDEKIVRAVAQTMLWKLGFKVLTAADGREAIEVFRKYADEIRLILLDSKMPHLNGEDAFPELQNIRSDVKVILSSGLAEEQATAKLAGAGLSGFIHKPYSFTSLKKKIREVLG